MESVEYEKTKAKYYTRAKREIDKANETLKKTGKEGRFYVDKKQVKTACGIAYNAVLLALDGYLLICGIEVKKGKKDIDFYKESVFKVDVKLLNYVAESYNILYLAGYCDGSKDSKVILAGFELAFGVINKIKPVA